MSIWVKIIIFLIIAHLIVGFGWLFIKLMPRKKPDNKNPDSE
jgi:Tfp pilus assembly protein PilO